MNPPIPVPGTDPCDSWLGGLVCSDVWEGPDGWFKDAIVGVAEAILAFAFALLGWVWNLITSVTRPQTDAAFLSEWAGRVFAITLPITLAFFVFQVVTVVLQGRSTGGLGKAVTMAAVAVVGTYASLPLIHLVTVAVDALADDLTAITLGDLENGGDRFVRVLSDVLAIRVDTDSENPLLGDQLAQLGAGSVIAGAVGFIIFGTFLVLGSLAVFAALLIRTMLLYIVIVMGPIAIMGLAWDKTRGWFRVWAGIVVALILSKLAIMIVFGLGVSVLESVSFESNGAGMAGALLTGTLILLIASLMPIACFKFVSFVGDEIHAGRLHADTTAAVGRVSTIAQRMSSMSILQSKQQTAVATVGSAGGSAGRSMLTLGGPSAYGGWSTTVSGTDAPAGQAGQPSNAHANAEGVSDSHTGQDNALPPSVSGGSSPSSGGSGASSAVGRSSSPLVTDRGRGGIAGSGTSEPVTGSSGRPTGVHRSEGEVADSGAPPRPAPTGSGDVTDPDQGAPRSRPDLTHPDE